jgi:hypothetical protein
MVHPSPSAAPSSRRSTARAVDWSAGVWSPEMVAKTLTIAVRWVYATGRADQPAAVRSQNLGFIVGVLTDDEFLEEFGADREAPEDPDEDETRRRSRRGFSPAEVSAMERALQWPVEYLDGWRGPANVLKVWLRTKAKRKPTFERAAKAHGWSRATAYRARDKALEIIAEGLNRDRIPVDLKD